MGGVRAILPVAVLGALQGATEFLPVSSSGHLVLWEHLLGTRGPGLTLEVGLHLGTLVAVLWYYGRDLVATIRAGHGWIWYLALASLPAGVAGLTLRPVISGLFTSLPATALAWCVSGTVLLWVSRRPPGKQPLAALTAADAWWIGLAQACALVPGISRSGATIVAGLLCGLEPEEAMRFGFLLSVPAVGGAVALHAGALAAGPDGGVVLGGAVVAALTGLAAIRWAVGRVRAGALGWCGQYCLGLGILVLLHVALTGEWR